MYDFSNHLLSPVSYVLRIFSIFLERDKGCNPVHPKQNGQNNYALVEEPAVLYDACPPLWNNEYSQAEHELKEDINERQQSQPVIGKTPTQISVHGCNHGSG